jgi:hypothetical protein
MGRRKTPSPEHRSPHEQRLREVVSELVQEESQKAAYLAFARELAAAERLSSFVHRSTMRRLGTVPQSARRAVQSPFSQRTKRIVQKWFERGLSGHLMWLIGERILGDG